MNNQIRRELLNRHRQSGFPGSIMDVFSAYNAGRDIISEFVQQQQRQQQLQQMQQMQQQQSQPIVANTPEEQEQGLRPYHEAGQTDQSMVFPNIPANTPFNTVGMKAPINIDKYDNQGHLIESFKSVPPGIQNLPTGPQEGTVVETPANMQTGGVRRYQTAGPRRNTNAEITTLQPMDVRPDPLVRDKPAQRVIDPRAQRRAEEQAFQTLMFNKTNEWRDPNKRAAMTSGRAESVSPATYVTPAGDLQAIIESGAQIAKGNYLGGGLGAGLAAASVLLPGTIRVPGNSLGENVGKELITPSTSSSWRSGLLPATQRTIDKLVYHSPEQQVRRGQEWMRNWVNNPETQRRIGTLVPEESQMVGDPRTIRNYMQEYDYNVTLVDDETRGLLLEENARYGRNNPGYSSVHHPVHRVEGSVSFPNQTVLDPDPIKNLETATVHELTHSVAPSEFINAATNSTILGKTKTSPGFEGTDIFRRWLTPEAKNAEDLYRRGIDTRTNSGALGYMSDPTEQHARIMQLRHMGDLKPGQQVNAATIKDLREQNRYTGAVEDKFFDIYQYPDRMANVFNTLPSIIPATVGVGLLNQSSDKSTNNNRGSLKFGGIREYQGGGSKNVDPFSSFEVAKHMARIHGGTPQQYLALSDTIGYHESGHTMDPKMVQKGSEIAKGAFQIEASTVPRLQQRVRQYAQQTGNKVPSWINIPDNDARNLSLDRQRALFLLDMNYSEGTNMRAYAQGKTTSAEQWLQGWKRKEAADGKDIERFETSANKARQMGIPNSALTEFNRMVQDKKPIPPSGSYQDLIRQLNPLNKHK